MKLIVGLGNPGEEYSLTRHNVGFMAIDHYLKNVDFKNKENYSYFEKSINGEKVLFLKPLTYMNDSGLAVRKVVDYYHIDIEHILIIHDDMDFEVGTFKIKTSGSSAGHNGIKSIISHLNTENFKRIRIGISKHDGDPINYVLGKFTKEDLNKLSSVFETVDSILEEFTKEDFNRIMNKYN